MNKNKNKFYKKINTTLLRWGFSKQGLFKNSKGEWYFFSQILVIILHLIHPYPKFENIESSIHVLFIISGVGISIQGLRITIQAFKDLGGNLTPLPYPMDNSILIKNSSYKKTRHPLYKGILFISLGICISTLSLIHLFLLLSLIYLLRKKALKEEEILKIKFPEYIKYFKEVPAIIRNIKYLDWRL